MTTKIRPLDSRLLVKMLAQDRSPGGIIIPQNNKSPFVRGLIVAAGPGRVLENGVRLEPQVREGDVVLFFRPSAPETSSPGEYFLREEDVYGVEVSS